MKISITHKAFENRSILQDVAFELKKGEITVLCGPSGCGKTTIMRLLSGLDTDFEGCVELDHSRLGFVFQEPRLLPWRTVYENVALVCDKPQEFIYGLLTDVGLQDVAGTMASKLSLGMARRVSIARALAVEPDVLILDEPFVSLDPERAETLRKLTFDLVSQKRLKALLVTHQPEEAIQLGSEIHILAGSPSRIRESLSISLLCDDRFNSTLVEEYYRNHKSSFAFS